MAAVSAEGSTVWVLMRRLNSSWSRSIASVATRNKTRYTTPAVPTVNLAGLRTWVGFVLAMPFDKRT
jgi:hypothetical protein